MSKEKQPKDPAEQGKEIKTAADLIQDEHNYRKHSDANKARIKKSIDEAGLGRSVVIDADGVLVAGNGVQQVIDKDTPVRVIETDGTELVVVKRTDLHTGDPRRKTLALADNATADDVEWDFEAIAEDWTEDEAGEWGVTMSATERLSSLKFQSVYYEPNEIPNIDIAKCIDKRKFEAKIKVIEESNLSQEQKENLKWFAYRFLRIDFQAVADYYAFKATEEEKDVIERLRLVLVDNGLQGFIEDDLLRIHEGIDGWNIGDEDDD